MIVLGLSAYYHDSAAALVRDGVILAAAQEERFTRRRHDRAFPRHALDYCLASAGLRLDQVDRVVFYERPWLKFARVCATWLAHAPAGGGRFVTTMSSWLTDKLHQRRTLVAELSRGGRFDPARLAFTEHHLSHAASAFFPSPFQEAAILVVDGVGEFATTTIGAGCGAGIELLRQLDYPHSLGLLYAAFTHHLGFKVNSGEYKVMGLAPYGQPRYEALILDRMVHVKDDGSFRLDPQFFDYRIGRTMTSPRFEALLGVPRREPEGALAREHFDLAASIQRVTERILVAITRAMAREDTSGNLCIAGGVALNCVANRRILDASGFRRLWVQPAAGDAGAALGAALVGAHLRLGTPRARAQGDVGDAMQGALLGPAFSQADCEARLRRLGAVFDVVDDEAELLERTATWLAEGQVVGWHQGRMEFGPRALGNRSILGDARGPDMQRRINLKIKFRESFRPFAPAVPAEDAPDWFDLPQESPYMLLVGGVRPAHAGDVPAVTHVDDSARVQTVRRDVHPRFHALLQAYARRTGCPVLVNTSFNVRGEPIVCTPEDAFACFMRTDLDALVVGRCVLSKRAQTARPPEPAAFEPD